jgi:hypothetical protein
MKPGPDWVAWILQFVLGFVVGGVLGFAMVVKSSGGRGALVIGDHTGTFLWGAALIGAGAASLVGDRLWLSNHYGRLAADAPQHSWATRLGSIAAGVFGIGLVITAVARSHW